MSFIKASSALALSLYALRTSAGAAPATYPTCESYGVDFQNGGTYFQNASSTDDFTFVSMFEQCQDDEATNILVDPNGDEYQCSNTPLQPDDTNQLSTCPMAKDDMWSGAWSVIIISNNGQADPIAYERDFNLVVATPVTVTYTPTITASLTTTPLTTTTILTTTTSSVTTTSTITQPAKTRKPTTTITPSPITSTKIWTLGTIRSTAFTISPVVRTSTITQTCSFSTQAFKDPFLTWTPTLLPSSVASSFIAAEATATTTSPPSRRDTPMGRRVPADRAARIAARKERLAAAALDRRGLDVATTTVTDLNTADYTTVTSTITAATSTVSLTSVITQVTTLTSITTVLQGTTTLPVVSITLPTPTKTALRMTVITSIVATVTKSPTYTVWQHTAASTATDVCTIKGGRMVG
ncbi:hypothetical protein PRZ48_006665 [Zasmidium cellare]|uniref:Uncharacterized protein n=1 Tax=Zasmidium cellare TaxID=395010 RepID=A0ABR0ENQ3_ZASCE|nr:hypothetical protein PRZ48_006665 [Zasmidium cellare]